MKRFLFSIIILTYVITGCSMFKATSNLPAYIKSIGVPVFINKTDRYNIEEYLTKKTIEEFLADGKVEIKDVDSADAVLKCEITKYVLTPILFDANQVPQQYRLRIYVNLYFFDNKKQEILWKEENLWEETTYYVVNNLGMPAEDETIASRRVMDNLSKRIVSRTIYGW